MYFNSGNVHFRNFYTGQLQKIFSSARVQDQLSVCIEESGPQSLNGSHPAAYRRSSTEIQGQLSTAMAQCISDHLTKAIVSQFQRVFELIFLREKPENTGRNQMCFLSPEQIPGRNRLPVRIHNLLHCSLPEVETMLQNFKGIFSAVAERHHGNFILFPVQR